MSQKEFSIFLLSSFRSQIPDGRQSVSIALLIRHRSAILKPAGANLFKKLKKSFKMTNHAPVLIAEDDPNDVFLLKRAFEKAGVNNPVVIARNGQEAIDYLNGSGKFIDRTVHPLPGLMFLDLKMPLVDGFDVLAWLHKQPRTGKVPVVVLTSSNQERDIMQAQQMGADDYRVKPQQFEELLEIVKDIRNRWLNSRP